MSNMTSTEKKRRFLVFSLIGLAIAIVIVFASFTFFAPEKPPATANLVASRSDTVKGQAGGQGSEEYNKKLATHDAQQANAALQTGDSFVPTPVGTKPSVFGKKEDTPPQTQPIAPVRVAPVKPARPANDAMLKRMMEDLAALDTRLAAASVGTGHIVYLRDFPADTGESAPVEQAVAVSLPTSVLSALKPGDLLYAVIDTGVNSDVPSAVMATVASGKYRNARLLGGFQRHDERLVLSFGRAVLPSGETIQLEAYAVDPATTEASVASSVNTHFFSRWGGLVASSFLEGLGSAKRYSGSQSTIYGGGSGESDDQMVWNTYSPADQAWIAAGKVGEKVGKVLERNFDRPPTVYLESGTPVGVLILNVKDR